MRQLRFPLTVYPILYNTSYVIHILSFPLTPIRLQVLYCFVGFMGFFLLPSSPAFAAVVINEIFPKPSNETGEWIELYNNGPNPASLEGWKLENTAGDKKTYIIGSGIIVPVNRFWTFDQTQTAISLYNEGDTVKLFKSLGRPDQSSGIPAFHDLPDDVVIYANSGVLITARGYPTLAILS